MPWDGSVSWWREQAERRWQEAPWDWEDLSGGCNASRLLSSWEMNGVSARAGPAVTSGPRGPSGSESPVRMWGGGCARRGGRGRGEHWGH